MQNHDPKPGGEIYHRIYRLVLRKIKPEQIALTLNLPVGTVKKVVNRLSSSKNAMESRPDKKMIKTEKAGKKNDKEQNSFLDVFLFPKSRYTIVDISGMFIKENVKRFEDEMNKIMESRNRVIALQMSDVINVDKYGLDSLIAFHEDFCRGERRYCAIFNPSPAIESLLNKHDVEKKIPVFGTEQAFERNAFRKRL